MKRRISDWRFLSSFHRILAFFYPTTLAVFFLGLNSCYNEPETLGGNIIPSSDIISVKLDTSFSVAAFTVSSDSIPGNDYGNAVLGSYNDATFGKVKSDFLVQLNNVPSTSDSTIYKLGHGGEITSLYLTLVKKKSWGQSGVSMNINVFELNDTLKSGYHNALGSISESYYPTKISKATTYEGDSLCKIDLTDEFIQEFKNLPDSAFTTSSIFVKNMKGLYFTCDDYAGVGGLFYSFSYGVNLEMAIRYVIGGITKTDTLIFYNDALSSRYNHYTHNYSGTPIESVVKVDTTITSTTLEPPVFYIDGLGGVRGLIKLNGLTEWKLKMPIAINRAELRFDVAEDPSFPSDSLITPLLFYYKRSYNSSYTNTSSDVVSIYDTGFTGVETSKYNKAKKYYSIDVSLHIQNLLKENNERDFFYLEPNDFKSFYDQGIFRSGSNSKPMKLYITYTKL